MRKNLLPNMQDVKLTDLNGDKLSMSVELRQRDNMTCVFMSDGNSVGSSALAKDAVFYLKKIAKRLGLDTEHTIFYRHIYQEQIGSLFGRFNVDWENNENLSYQFKMLTNVDDLVNVKEIIEDSETISLAEFSAAAKNAA